MIGDGSIRSGSTVSAAVSTSFSQAPFTQWFAEDTQLLGRRIIIFHCRKKSYLILAFTNPPKAYLTQLKSRNK